MSQPETQRVRPRGGLVTLKDRNFRLLFAAQSVSVVGDAAYGAVLAWFTFEFTGSSLAVSYVLGATALATLASLLVGGVLADRWDRRALMVISDGSRFVLVGTIALLIWTGTLTLPMLVMLTAAAGLVDGLFSPSLGGILPTIVPSDKLISANGLIGFTRASGSIVGAALGGTLYALQGAAPIIGLNAISFGVSAVLIALLPKPSKQGAARQHSAVRDLGEGFTYVFTVPVLISIPIAALALMFADAPTSVLMPAVVRDHWRGGAELIGWLRAAYGIGTALGALLTGHLGGGRRPAAVLFGCWALAHLAAAVMVAQPIALLAVVFSGLRGVLGGAGGTLWNDLLMRNVPGDKLSRVFSIDTFGASALMPLGVAVTGVLATNAAAVPIVVGGQLVGFVLMAALLLRAKIRNA